MGMTRRCGGLSFFRLDFVSFPGSGASRASFAAAAKKGALIAGAMAASLAALAPAGALAREVVAFPLSYPPGMIVIKESERKLYYVMGNGEAIRYPVAIGKAGKAWRGEAYIAGKFVRPAWSAPADVRRDHPNFPDVIPGGSPRNPMGAAALTLSLSEVAIHGTSQSMRKSVGTAASYGCIRMLNEDVVDLYGRVRIGTPVIAIP
ncbi:ErfK/YbiS/YcfS/YnhG family protein [Methylocella tundrae]|uniref:ErfK/YbiS/YcfS/YnhG family protein n=2 Tax=Methylocella tundrae TaxID=227605 RepID=A0A4U8YVW9_METTU|nr:ErfK/YbiS/YcfS/YnhG family protein [Methylocella tundrae]